MSLEGLGCAKTKSDLVLMPNGRQVFAFFCSAPDHRPQNSGCSHTAQRFHTVWVKGAKPDNRRKRCDSRGVVVKSAWNLQIREFALALSPSSCTMPRTPLPVLHAMAGHFGRTAVTPRRRPSS